MCKLDSLISNYSILSYYSSLSELNFLPSSSWPKLTFIYCIVNCYLVYLSIGLLTLNKDNIHKYHGCWTSFFTIIFVFSCLRKSQNGYKHISKLAGKEVSGLNFLGNGPASLIALNNWCQLDHQHDLCSQSVLLFFTLQTIDVS